MNYLPLVGFWFYGALDAAERAAYFSSYGLLDAAGAGIPITPSEMRTYSPTAENRILSIGTENRVLSVGANNRVYSVPVENRILIV